MAGNPIKKLIQLVLDRQSAKTMEDDAKKSFAGVDRGVGTLEKTVKRLGAAIIAAFALNRIKAFGAAAIREAKAAELAWSNLENSVENAGVKFNDVEQDIKALASAFQEVTVHEADDFAVGLNDLIGITGDFEASINNMGLVANVAARFFDGNLAPAVDLVGRVMVGQTRQLRMMGIVVSDAQKALEILAERSMGAAETRAESFAGKVQILTNDWNDFLESIGFVIVGNEEMGGSMETLSQTLKNAAAWVDKNEEAIRSFLNNGLKIAIAITDGAIRTFFGFAELMAGSVTASLGVVARGAVFLADAFLLPIELASKFGRILGFDVIPDAIDGFTGKINAQIQRLKEWGDTALHTGEALTRSGIGRFTTSITMPSGGGPRRTADDVLQGSPRLAANTVGDPEAAKKAAAEEARLQEEARKMVETTRTAYEEYAATIIKAKGHLDAKRLSVEEYNRVQATALETLAKAVAVEDKVAEAYAAHDVAMRTHAVMVSALGSEYDALEAEANILAGTIQALADEGIPATDAGMAAFVARLREVQTGLANAKDEAATLKAVGDEAASFIAAVFTAGIGPAAAARAKVNALEAVEHGVRALVAGLTGNPVGAVGHLTAAAKFAGIAAAWGALAASFGGGSGGGAGTAGGRGGGGGMAGGPMRLGDVGGAASERMVNEGPEVHVHFVGPGFDAVNPEVQRVVLGAEAQARERFGPNARVRVHGRRNA